MRRLRGYSIELVLAALLVAAVSYFGFLGYGLLTPAFVAEPFSGERALQYSAQQLEYGVRTTGSEGNIRMGDWLVEELRLLGWDVVVQPFTVNEIPARNIIAIRSTTPAPSRSALIMTHYDTRLYADRDPVSANHIQPPPGANAGASGTAVLLELARTLDVAATGHTVCLVFLDAEENDGLDGWDRTLGADQLIARLDADLPRCRTPRVAIYVDLVGGRTQRLYAESLSDRSLTTAIWGVAAELGHGSIFINEPTWTAVDAARRFDDQNVPSTTIADFNYPYRDTLQDTLEQLSAQSLERVGATLKTWLERGAPF
jgi:hypothetical protein